MPVGGDSVCVIAVIAAVTASCVSGVSLPVPECGECVDVSVRVGAVLPFSLAGADVDVTSDALPSPASSESQSDWNLWFGPGPHLGGPLAWPLGL